jgi:hypothetical protein
VEFIANEFFGRAMAPARSAVNVRRSTIGAVSLGFAAWQSP